MSYLSLYRKWRPGTFDDVLGQGHVTETLRNSLKEDRLSHAYLFAGPRGCGKTSTARILARALNCERGPSGDPCGECTNCRQIAEGSSLDVFEMDAASHTSVEDVRDIRDKIPFAAVGGGYKVYIIDEAHMLSTPAFNALLKMLEEPPPHVVFVLCTTESHKLPATVISRCQRFEFRRWSTGLAAEHLARVAKQEGVDADPKALNLLARHAHGSARDALSLLDQAASTADGTLTEQVVTDILGEAPEDVLLEIGDAIGTGEIMAAFAAVDRMIDRGWDPRQLLRQLIEHIRALFLARRGAEGMLDLDADYAAKVHEQAQQLTEAQLEWALRVLGETQADVRWSSHPRLTLEVALARASRLEADPRTLVARVERLERHLLQPHSESAPARPPSAPERSRPEPAAPAPEPEVIASPVAVPAASTAPVPETEPAVPAPAVPVRTASVDATLDELWPQLLEAVRARKRTAHVNLKEGWPIEINGDEIVVGFARSFYAEAMKRQDLFTEINVAIESVFGRKLHIRGEHVKDGPPASGGAAATSAGEPDAPNAPGGGSAIDLLVSGLGAEIIEES